jgi:hypothetical protein
MADRKQTAIVDLKVRMKEPLRARLASAAASRGGSMNAEAIARLEDSFRAEDLLPQILDLAYGPAAAGLLMLLGRSIRHASLVATLMAERPPEDAEKWIRDPWTYGQIEELVKEILQELRPRGDKNPPKTKFDYLQLQDALPMSDIGRRCAKSAVRLARHPNPEDFLESSMGPVRQRLGDALTQREDDDAR